MKRRRKEQQYKNKIWKKVKEKIEERFVLVFKTNYYKWKKCKKKFHVAKSYRKKLSISCKRIFIIRMHFIFQVI